MHCPKNNPNFHITSTPVTFGASEAAVYVWFWTWYIHSCTVNKSRIYIVASAQAVTGWLFMLWLKLFSGTVWVSCSRGWSNINLSQRLVQGYWSDSLSTHRTDTWPQSWFNCNWQSWAVGHATIYRSQQRQCHNATMCSGFRDKKKKKYEKW